MLMVYVIRTSNIEEKDGNESGRRPMLKVYDWIGLELTQPRQRVVDDCTEYVLACWWVALFVREGRKSDLPH